MPAAEYLTVAEAAARLRLSVSGTYALIREGVLPAARIGKSLRVSERVLRNFVEAGGRSWPGGWKKTATATGT
jgi:excisionase family DNA binding protein